MNGVFPGPNGVVAASIAELVHTSARAAAGLVRRGARRIIRGDRRRSAVRRRSRAEGVEMLL
jgi:hypothetical protein